MDTIITEIETAQEKTSIQSVNRRRWTSYVARLAKHVESQVQARHAIAVLLGVINSRKRWVRTKEEEFLKLLPDWTPEGTRDYIITKDRKELKLHTYLDPASGQYYFSRFMTRQGEDHVLPDWHVSTCSTLKRRGLTISKELSTELYTVGTLIVESIRAREGIWRRTTVSYVE